MSNHPNRSWRRVMNSAADAHLARYPWHDSGAYMMTPEQLRESLKTAYIAGYSEGRLALSTASKRKKGADHVYINGKKIELRACESSAPPRAGRRERDGCRCERHEMCGA